MRIPGEIALQFQDVLGNVSAELGLRRSAYIVFWSEPGARPRPRSIRPGYMAANVPNCSAMISGEWFGSITPPAPSLMLCV